MLRMPILAVLMLLSASRCLAAPLDLDYSGGRLGINAQAVTVKEVVEALAARQIVRVTMDEASAFRARLTTVNMRFGRRDLAAALDAILAEVPHELLKNPDGSVAEVQLINPLLRGSARVALAPSALAAAAPASHEFTQIAPPAARPVAAASAPAPAPATLAALPPAAASAPASTLLVPVTEAPAAPNNIGGLEMPSWASPDEKAQLPAIRAELEAAKAHRPPPKPRVFWHPPSNPPPGGL